MSAEIETYRGFVYPWSIDHVGHMNVQFYTARFDEASWHFLAHLSLTPRFLREQNRGVVALDQRTQYRIEVLAGSLLHICTELIEVQRKTLRYVHRMRDSETGDVVATMELLVAYLDRAVRKTTLLPEEVLARAQAMLSGPQALEPGTNQ